MRQSIGPETSLLEKNRCKPTPPTLKALYSLAFNPAYHSPHGNHCDDPAVPDATSTVSFAPLRQFRFQSLDEVSSQPISAYGLPSSRVQQPIDNMCQPGPDHNNLDNGTEAAKLQKAHAALIDCCPISPWC